MSENATAFNVDGVRVYAADKDMDCIAFYEPQEDGHWISAENPVTLRGLR